MRCLNDSGVKKNKGLERSLYYSAITVRGSQCQHLHPCLLLYIVLIVIYHMFPIIGRFHLPLSIRIGTGGGKKSKWVIHYNPKISRKAESIIPLLLLFKSSPQSFPPPTHPTPTPPRNGRCSLHFNCSPTHYYTTLCTT